MSRYSISAYSLFPYFTKVNASTADEKRIQGLLYALKNGEKVNIGSGKVLTATAWLAEMIKDAANTFPDFVGPGHHLIPVPSSSVTPTPASASAWPMYDVAGRLQAEGLASTAQRSIMRATEVASSHGGGKPSVREHEASFVVDAALLSPTEPVTLLDDVLTTGTTAMGCVLALRKVGFTGEVRLLTATHTVGSDYNAGPSASARSEVVWFDDREWRRAWRPPKDVVFC